jgi:phosphoribosylformylglycinamidine synthase
VETHNSPSALDPYGGALTGIVGVNRDPMGTGLGAELVCNTDVFCFASPFYSGELPPRLLHPRRVLEGVREGVEHGGNKSGVPTVNGSLVFEERFLGKPLVYCGTAGIIPRSVAGKPGHQKKARAGDAIVMAGGRIGKDGIHGATFSSEELHAGSPATAVQIGDPITQRKLYDCLIKARDLGLYTSITDNGAGGLSSSVGEMAVDTGGCRLDLARAPLKYDGLRPWEILLSEAQERMTLAVPQEKLQAFLDLAAEMDVEAVSLGEFTDSGFFHITYDGKPVAFLDLGFMHDGVPQLRLKAVWPKPARSGEADGAVLRVADEEQGKLLRAMLGRLNICSKEYLIRQYDHEVKGGSVIKPLVGVKRDGPADAGVVRPLLDCEQGLVLAHGICPKYSDYDSYWMVANAMDEAVRNAVAVGADPSRLAGVDNFCWCDPVQSERTPDGQYKLAQLVRANKALYDCCLAYLLPCVSGKDSMKNDYADGGVKISIPPTVLFSVLGIVPDVTKAVSSDFKRAGDRIYLLGKTFRELAGSELGAQLGVSASAVPRVEFKSAALRYRTLFSAMQESLASACHDLSDGGLAVALAEMAIGGRLGAVVDMEAAQSEPMTAAELLYSESASRLLVTVPENRAGRFEALFSGQACACIGRVAEGPELLIRSQGRPLLREQVDALAEAFKATFKGF